MDFLKVLILLSSFLIYVSSLKILAVFPVPAPSHNILAGSLVRGLAEKGHELVMVTSYKQKMPKELKYTEILLTGLIESWNKQNANLLGKLHAPFWHQSLYTYELIANVTRQTLTHPNFKKLLKTHHHFDVVIVHQHHMNALNTLAWHYKAPLVLFSSLGSNGWNNLYTANPFPTSYIPEVFSGYATDMSFWQRAHNTAVHLFLAYYNHMVLLPGQKQIKEEFFPTAPPFDDVVYNASLMLLMSDISTYPAVPKVPNMIDIGGFHVKPAKTLPLDLQKMMDNAKDGVVYFSLGSNLKSADMKPEVRNVILKVFSKLKQKVLWKWEEDNLPGRPENVEIRKWLPQQEILGHPNLRLFISHGGLLSTTEAVYHGVPMLAIPVFFDQYLNSKIITNNGFGLNLPYENLNEQDLESMLTELLKNSTYTNRAKVVSKIFHDKPMTPIDTANYWIEYVVRHNGATHLQVAGLKLTWYQY